MTPRRSPDPRRPAVRPEEALSAAFEQLRAGRPEAEILRELPSSLHAAFRAGLELDAARGAAPGEPRASFVLGLEEQLRTDLRLAGAGMGAGAARLDAAAAGRRVGSRVALLLLALLLAGALGLYGVAREAEPGSWLYPVKRAGEIVMLGAARSPEARAARHLDYGWRRLEEADSLLVTAARADEGAVRAVLDDLVSSYDAALRLAEGQGDRRAVARARADLEAASDRLGDLASELGPDRRPPILAARARLRLELVETRVVHLPPPPDPVRQVPPPRREAPTATAGPAPTAIAEPPAPTKPATPVPTAPPVAPTSILPPPSALPPTATPPPPEPTRPSEPDPATATPRPPSPGPTPSPTPLIARPTEAATLTPAPSPTDAPNEPATPTPVPTQDRWPTATVPPTATDEPRTPPPVTPETRTPPPASPPPATPAPSETPLGGEPRPPVRPGAPAP